MSNPNYLFYLFFSEILLTDPLVGQDILPSTLLSNTLSPTVYMIKKVKKRPRPIRAVETWTDNSTPHTCSWLDD
jgi:hypothetical protein